ncbi:polysaccharide biosynthesis/export family protein [Desulfobacula phenolica]|uniref:Polysaccharide export outer membrane protein n=1 Tax=Desulfobacula phenolica TaxID=90732 RepID=A0A1H2DTM1_9BACT|nr:polysaccharide biosynthesis/export family protein [Desulfobacula phenolica]SDT86223.1 polysaccharide export outer membrane protein [Desulfobacula phenolica]
MNKILKYQEIIKYYQEFKVRTNFKNLIALVLIIIFCTSCTGKSEIGISKETIYDRPMPKVEHEYLLGPGDVLEIVYHYTPRPDTKAYVLSVADVLKVEFAYHPDMNRELVVRPDGNITMPKIGAVYALGLTPLQLQKKIKNIYGKDFIDPIVTVTMIQYNRTIDRLKKAITTSSRGQSKLSAIRPDGYLSFPIISDVMAGGKTLPEVKEILTKQYQAQIDNLTITLILKVMKANLVYIMGEVSRPDSYLVDGSITVTQLIARAGGTKDTAEKSTILVISRDKKRRPWGRLVNLEKVLYNADLSQDLVLNQYDIVYVPKSAIARRNLFVDQYINKMIPTSLIGPYEMGGAAFGGTLIETKPIIK